jgi:predicted ATPase/DNA-binding CsgD family transcriptional regulator
MPSQHVPVELNRFIGRERDLAELARLVSEAGLVTLTGPGGMGKSRLAGRLLSQSLDSQISAVVVQLAATSDPELVVHVVASSLAIRGESGQPLIETLASRLRHGRFVILLDNCDRVLDSTALLAQTLLDACPTVRLVATSREPLNVPGEIVWPLEGLPEVQAVALFIERARQIQRDFGGTQVVPALVDICRRLDGMPLAIELAAAQIAVMPASEIRAQLDEGFTLLAVPGGTDPRHATLKMTVDWSYDLLRQDERTIFRRLSIFPAAFDLRSATAVCEPNVVPTLAQLVEKSMVVAGVDAQGSRRYHILDTMRHYGRDHLEKSGERPEVERRLIGYYAAAFDVSITRLRGREQKEWLTRTELENDNLRGVLNLARARDPATMIRLAAALTWFWFVRGHWTEGLEWTEAALAASPEPSSARARLLSGAVSLARYLNRYSQGFKYGEESLRLYEELHDEVGRAQALFEVGWLAMPSQRFDEAEARLQEVLRISRAQRSAALTIRAFFGLGQVRWRLGKSLEARRFLLQAESLARSLDDAWLRIALYDTLGHVSHDLRDFEQARRYFQEGHNAAQELGDRYHAAHTLANLAYVDLDTGDLAAMEVSLQASLPVSVELGQRVDVSLCLDGFALLASARHDHQRALVLFAAADAIRHSIGAGWSSMHKARVKAAVARCEKELPRDRARRYWNEGQSMTIDGAVRSVLAREAPVAVDLSHREHTIAALIGEGLTSAQIAARLMISERTVDSHAEHIRNKLGLHSRAQIAAWAVREMHRAPLP